MKSPDKNLLFRVDVKIYLGYNELTHQREENGMKEIGKQLRALRDSINLSQEKLSAILGTTQSSINRYENDQANPPVDLLCRYADYFDVSMDYICGRTDKPEGQLYEFHPKVTPEKEDMRRFIEMCFEPGSLASRKLKESLLKIMEEEE